MNYQKTVMGIDDKHIEIVARELADVYYQSSQIQYQEIT